jgi:hypothetical protein
MKEEKHTAPGRAGAAAEVFAVKIGTKVFMLKPLKPVYLEYAAGLGKDARQAPAGNEFQNGNWEGGGLASDKQRTYRTESEE